MFKSIMDKLKEKELNPYPTGKHMYRCESPYCIVKEGTATPSAQSNRLGEKAIEIIILVPLSSYIALELYAKQIRAALKELPNLRKTGFETPPIIVEEKQAYSMSIEYIIIKKLG